MSLYKALAASQPDAEPEVPATDRAGAAPLASLALRADASTPGGAPQRDPPEPRAGSEARETTPDIPWRAAEGGTSPSRHNREDDSFDALGESCRGDPQAIPAPETPRVHAEPRRDQAGNTPLTAPRQAHLQRNYTALSKLPLRARGRRPQAARRTGLRASATPQERARAWKRPLTPLASLSARRRGPPRPGGGGTWTTHAWRATPATPANKESKRRPKTWASGPKGLPQGSSSTWQSAFDGCFLRRPATSRREHAPWQTSRLAIGRGKRPLPPWNPPGQWHYGATRLMAHMGAYSLDEMNRLHWRGHQRAALRIRVAIQDHDIWDIPGSPGYQEHASGHRRPRSQDVPEPPRQAARRNSLEHPQGRPPGRGSPSGTYSSPLRPFAPRRSPGSPHSSWLQDGTPEKRQETRKPGRSRRRSRTPAPRRGESSSMRIWTGTTGAPATPTLGKHHRPPTPDAGPRGPAPNGRTSPPFSRRPSASGRQRFNRTPAGQRAKRPAYLLPPSRGQRPTHCRGDHTPQTRDQGSLRPTQALRKERGGSPHHSPETAKPRRAHRGSLDTTRAAQRRTQKLMGTPVPQEPAGPLPTTTPCSVPRQQEPSTEYVPGGHPGKTSRQFSPADAALDQDRVAMPPPPPRPPQQGGTGPFDDAGLRALYGIHASTPSSELVATLRENLRKVDPNRLFAVVPLPHATTTQIFVRQHWALVIPGTQLSDDLVEAWIWWFNTQQPAQGGVWVPHLGWVHTLVAPPTDPRPAPSTRGREQAATPTRPDHLRIPPHDGLEACESGTARSRGHNLMSLAAHYPETARAAPPAREPDPGTIAMIVLENGHYYQVRIIPHAQESHWSLEAVDCMLLATTDLPDSPTPLLPGEPPDPLTAIVSGTAGTWNPGHALYCLWRWARRRWPHTTACSAAWRFYLDSRQQMEGIPEQTAETPTAPNLCPVFVIHQIPALALGEQLQPAIRTEMEAQAAHTALVHQLFSALRSALVRRGGNAPWP